MYDLTVKLTIPVPCERLVSAPSLTFASWLPIGDAEAIRLDGNEMALKLWFDRTSAWGSPKEEELAYHLNVLVDTIFADVVLRQVPDELAHYMARRDFTRRPTPEEEPLQRQYDEIAYSLFTFVIGTVNRLLSYVRSKKGQYWLGEYPLDRGIMASYFNRFEAKATFADHPPFRFGPTQIDERAIEWISEDRYIQKDEWDEIRAFIYGKSRPPLVGTLLAGAEALAARGQNRSALTEATTALEVALYAFAKNPNAESAFGPYLAKRLNVSSLQNQVEHVGLTGSINYLIPTILPEWVLPQHVIEGCQAAIAQRQNVVHQGQREVEAGFLKASLNAIRAMCETLESLTTAEAE
jgi:hypothetical protein